MDAEKLAEAIDVLFDQIPESATKEEIEEGLREAGFNPNEVRERFRKVAAVVVPKPSIFKFRKHYPAKESRHLFKMFGQMDLDDVMTVVPLAVKMVESWELEGDPSDLESYDNLNIFTMLNLYRDITTFWNTHLKN